MVGGTSRGDLQKVLCLTAERVARRWSGWCFVTSVGGARAGLVSRHSGFIRVVDTDELAG
jgi:hypothetical protein